MSKEHFFENILGNNQNGFMVLNRKKEIIYMNKQIVKMYEVEIKKNLNDYLKCGNTNCENISCENTKGCKICVINKSIDRVIKFKKEEMLTEVVLNLDKKYIKLNCKIYLSDDFIVLEFLSLTEEEEKIQYITKILDHSHDLLFYKDSSLRYKYLNMSFANLFGKEKSEIYDKTDRDLLPEELYHQCLKGDLEVIEKGSYIGIEKFGDRDYKVLKELVDDGILGVVKDITEELKQTRLAETDSLTELYNRRKFLKMIDYIYENKINSYYLILIDLDDLRNLNNNDGHLKGDLYLKKLGEILNNNSAGLFFRTGGDEFAGLVNRDEKKVREVLDNIYKKLSNLGLTPKLSISTGAAKIEIEKTYLENYETVDKLLYRVKHEGKNNYIIA